MPKINLSIPHTLGTEEAKQRINKLATETKKQFGGMVTDLEESWTNDTGNFKFRAMGMAVAGRLDVEPAQVRIELGFPLAALAFKSRIEQEITSKAKALLA